MPENVSPSIADRDFVIATVVAPTILVEPEKTEETATEGEVPAEGTAEGVAESGAGGEEGKDKAAKTSDDKGKTPAGDKSSKTSDDKGKSPSKETKKK